MALFNFHFDRPGPGVSPDAPRKKGPARFFEILGRDLTSFYLAGLLALVSALPFVFGVWFAVDTHSLVPLLLAGVLGGMIAAPQLCGLLDTILRSLRDEPGFWWATYRRAWKRNVRASLLPGAICGLLLAMQIFTVFHYDVSAGVVPEACFCCWVWASSCLPRSCCWTCRLRGWSKTRCSCFWATCPAPRWA